MDASDKLTIVVTGATGLQGGAVVDHLLRSGWRVRALTRRPASSRAKSLSTRGADVVRGDMSDPASLRRAFAGAYGVYSVQNPVISGVRAEVEQGSNVGDAAKEVGVQHFVYASAGVGGDGAGIPSWESKLHVQSHLEALGLPLTVLRPMAFMELMTEKKFFPQVSTWHVMPTLTGESREVAWLAVDDLGAITARVFADPARFVGGDLALVSDVQSIASCRALYREVMSRAPPRVPMPVWMFERLGFIGYDLSTMWRWLRTARFEMDQSLTREIHPEASTVRSWLSRLRGRGASKG